MSLQGYLDFRCVVIGHTVPPRLDGSPLLEVMPFDCYRCGRKVATEMAQLVNMGPIQPIKVTGI